MVVVAGVDIGSLTAKTVILDNSSHILSHSVVAAGIVDEQAARTSFGEALQKAQLDQKDVDFIVTTGYGRTLVNFGNKNITEISCHARGANYLVPGVRTVIDIGGQDSKVISLDGKGTVIKFAMNDKCAAGTGRFLEVMANALGVKLENMGPFSLESREPLSVSSICTVFAESEVISLKAKGHSKVDIIAGIHYSIARRMLSLTNSVGLRAPLMMSGGVAKNIGVVRALEKGLNTQIIVPEEPQIVGALGAALFALEGRLQQTPAVR